jgi:hypothetical protein
MREARAEREAERERMVLAAQAAAQPQFAIAYPYWRPHGARRQAGPRPVQGYGQILR